MFFLKSWLVAPYFSRAGLILALIGAVVAALAISPRSLGNITGRMEFNTTRFWWGLLLVALGNGLQFIATFLPLKK